MDKLKVVGQGSTVWEVHPVTQFYVCNLKNNQVCDKNSPDSDWTSLDNVP